jgi:hypothetical protein
MPDVQNVLPAQRTHYFPWSSRPVEINPRSPLLRVSFGQATFDTEGTEMPGRFFSRRASWPGTANSGVTLGRGYDLGSRTQLQVLRELTLAGVPRADARMMAAGAGLRGSAADLFIKNRDDRLPIISLEAQQRLFESITTPETIADIKRIFAKHDVVNTYGEVAWDFLPPTVQEIVFDLRYRGDYTPSVRRSLQPILVKQDWKSLQLLMSDREFWGARGVPPTRILAREQMATRCPGLK